MNDTQIGEGRRSAELIGLDRRAARDVVFAGATALTIGVYWLVAWLTGAAAGWSADGVLTMKSNLALGIIVAGAALLLLGRRGAGDNWRRPAGVAGGSVVLLIGILTLAEHLFGYDFGIDQLLASEAPGAVATASPNRMGVPGAASLVVLAAGLLALARRRPLAAHLGVAAFLINLVPLVGFLYRIHEFYGQPRLISMGIAWPSMVALMALGAGLILAQPEAGPVASLRRRDAGGILLRQWLPAVVLVPLIMGFVWVRAERGGVFGPEAGTGVLIVGLIVIFLVLLWHSANGLSRLATIQAAVEAELRSAALFPLENPGPVLRAGRDGRLLFANPAAAPLLAEWQSEIGQRPPAPVRHAIANALQTGRAGEMEVEVGEQCVSLALIPIPERDYVNLYGRDITEHRRVERELRESESRARVAEAVRVERQRLDELLTMLPVYVILLSPDYRVPFANRFFEQRFGKSNGKRCFEYLFNRSEPCEICETFKVLKTNAPLEWEWTGPDGRHYEIHDFPFKDADGSPLIMEVGVDITARKRAEAALKEANERLEQRVAERTTELREKELELREAQRIAHIGSWYWEVKTDVLTGSDELLRILGLDPATQSMAGFGEQRGRCYPPEEWERVNAAVTRTLETGEAFELDVRAHRNGTLIWVTIRGEPIRGSNGEVRALRGTVQDITQRKHAEEEKKVAAEFLGLVNSSAGLRDLIEGSVRFFTKVSGCEAVGIRVREGNEYPYHRAQEFRDECALAENSRCTFGVRGEFRRDPSGDRALRCLCGNIIDGRFDPSKPCFTRAGSFWTNCATDYIRASGECNPRGPAQNRGNGTGIESIALVPLQVGDQRLGLLQVTDRRKGLLSLETIQQWERLVGYLAVAVARLQAEESLRKSEEQFRRAIEQAPIPVIMHTEDGQVLQISRTWSELTGYGLQDVPTLEAWLSRGCPEGAEAMRSHVRSLFHDGLRSVSTEFPIRTRLGQPRHWSFSSSSPGTLPDGRRFVVGMALDITERKRAEEALRESERFYRQTLESIPGMVFTTRPDGYCDYQSQQWVDFTGVPMSEHLGDGWNKLLHPDDRPGAFAAWRAAVEERAPYDLEYRVRRRDGEYQWFKVIGRPIRGGSGEIVRWFGVAANIDELKRKDDALRAAKEELARANEGLERQVQERTAKLQEMVGELEHFSYTITHDMRAPLRAMHGYADIVTELCADCPEGEPQRLLRRIVIAADRMDLLITDALNYSKAVRQELPLGPVDPGALLRGMLDSYPELQPSKANIQIVGELPLVIGNEAGLTQCFSNLLGNAVKFVAPGRAPQVRIRAESRPRWVRLWFEDNGIGIPAVMLPRLFEMFSHGTTNAGTGIGLALVRKVMDRMSGKAGVESEEGKGSRFWLDLQAAAPPAIE